MSKPLAGILVIDLSQFLSGPSASLRLADLGARVIKIEKPGIGDICRTMYVSDLNIDGDSSLFHAINRNKESFVADLKDEAGREQVMELIKQADVVMHNFRPGVIERLGLDYEKVKAVNPGVVYGEISGYGSEGPWVKKPGQDLLVQSLSGITQLSGNGTKGPVPMGISMVDILTGTYLTQGILAGLVRKGVTGEGALVQVSMLECAADFQFETITTYYRDGGQPTVRGLENNAHAYLGAPYGIYSTQDGYLALAMGSIPVLGQLLSCSPLLTYPEPASWFTQRDEIKKLLAEHLKTQTTQFWLGILEPADIWCAEVLDWEQLFAHDGFKALNMIQNVTLRDGYQLKTTRCPITIDGEPYFAEKGAPKLGGDTAKIIEELLK